MSRHYGAPRVNPPMASSYNALVGDEEAGYSGKSYGDASYSFAEKQVRLGFVRKVFGLLSAQLAVTAFFTGLFSLHQGTRAFVLSNMWLFWTSFGVSMACILSMGISERLRRQYPTNLILLGIFTLAESILVATVSAAFAPQIVLLAVGITAGVVFGLFAFTLQGKVDLTPYSGALFSFFTALFFASIIQMFVRAPALHLFLCASGVVMFSVYLVFDLQMVMGGHKYALSPDEYVFATLNLYIDIVNLFLYILQLLNGANRD